MDDLKKLMMNSLLRNADFDEKPQPPMGVKEEKEILNKFADPEYSDIFDFTLTKNNFEPGKLFSRASLEKFLHILRLYIGGRILGNFNKTNKEPEVLLVHVHVEHLTKKEYEERLRT